MRKREFLQKRSEINVLLFTPLILILLTSTSMAQSIKPSFDIYADYTYDMTEGKRDINSFNIKRAYFGVKGSLTDEKTEGLKVNYRLTLDIGEFSDIGAKGIYNVKEIDSKDSVDIKSSSANGFYIAYLKYAYLELEDLGIKGLKFQLGQIPTLWVSFEDKFLSMRWWTSSFTDRSKVLSSADRGISLLYSLPAKYGEVALSIVNGEGYKKPEDTKMKDYGARISIRPLPDVDIIKGLMLHTYLHYGKANYDTTYPDAESVRERMVFALSFDYEYLDLLGQYLMTEDGFDSDNSKVANGSGYSIAMKVKLEKLLNTNQTGLFLRYDHFDPDTNKEKDAKSIIIAGPYYYFVNNRAAIGLNYTREMFEDTEKYKDISQLILQALISY